jgi:hypothetical protein
VTKEISGRCEAQFLRDYERDYGAYFHDTNEKRSAEFTTNRLFLLARPERFELATTWFVA